MGIILINGSNEGGSSGGHDTSQVTATASDVLMGKKIVNSSGSIITGTMPDNGDSQYATSMSYNTQTSSYAFNNIPEGYYHDVSTSIGYPEVRLSANTLHTFMEIPSENIKADGKYQGVGTATASDVLSGKTFSNASGSGLSGSIAIKSPITKTLELGETYTFPSGYYSGASTVTAPSSSGTGGGTATAGRILEGYTAYVNNNLITGTLPDYSNKTVDATTSWDSTNSKVLLKIPNTAMYSSYTSYLSSSGSNFGNATAANVLADKTFTSTAGLKATGSMVNRSGTSGSFGEYSATASYDSNNNRIRMRIPAAAYYNTYNYLYANGSAFGDSTPGKVLEGNTFTSSSGINQTGTLTNNGNTTQSATASFDSTNNRIQMTIPANGYYNTSSKLYSAGTNFGDATAGKVLTGNTFTSNSGLKINGTMPSYSSHTSSSDFTTSTFKSGIGGYVFATPNNAGYYSTSTYIRVPVANLSASNIKKNVTVGGITGTFEGYVTTPLQLITASSSGDYPTFYNGFEYAKGSCVTYRGSFNNAYDSIEYMNSNNYTGFTLDMSASGSLTADPYCLCRLNSTAFPLNSYSKIIVKLTSVYSKSQNITIEKPRFGVSTNGALTSASMNAYTDVTLGVNQGVYTIDVSNLTGSYYFYIWLKITRDDTTDSQKVGYNRLLVYDLKVTD